MPLIPSQIGIGGRAPAANTWLAPDVGSVFRILGKQYMLIQVLGADAAPARRLYAYTVVAGVPTFTACIPDNTNNDWLALGVFDPSQVALTAGDFALIQVSGPFQYIADAAVAAGALLGCGAVTAGRMSSAAITAGVGQIGTSTSAPGGAGTTGYGIMFDRF